MSHVPSRAAFTLAALTSLTLGCASEQKSAESPEQGRESADSSPRPGDATIPQPNGQPTETPPDAPPPVGLNQGTTGNALAAPGAPSTAPTGSLSEGQIAMIIDLANTAEIEQGKLVQAKGKAASVKKFAAKMVKHHTDAKVEQAKLTKQLVLSPTPSQEADVLKSDGDVALSRLRTATAAELDATYIDGQVEAHREVLELLEQQLLPSAKTEPVVNALRKMRDLVAAHLEEAKSIQAELKTSN